MTRELTGRHVFFALALFFGVILAVNIDLVLKAQSSFSGEDERKSYLQGLAFNKTLARRAEQARLGWRAEVSATRNADGDTGIKLVMLRPDGEPLSALKLIGRLRHPSDARQDREMIFQARGNGLYTAELPNVSHGGWTVIVRSAEGTAFEAERRIWLP